MTAAKKKILVVEDNRTIAASLALLLEGAGSEVTVAADLESARCRLEERSYDLFLLDVGLPDGSGFDLCQEIRLKAPAVPILMLTAKTDEESAVTGLATGADDYIRKPFGNRELLARIQRCFGEKITRSKKLVFGELELDPENREAIVGGKPLKLKPKELLILSLLVHRQGDVVTREELLRHVDKEAEIFDSSLDPHISRLRQALARAGAARLKIVSEYGLGYRLKRE